MKRVLKHKHLQMMDLKLTKHQTWTQMTASAEDDGPTVGHHWVFAVLYGPRDISIQTAADDTNTRRKNKTQHSKFRCLGYQCNIISCFNLSSIVL